MKALILTARGGLQQLRVQELPEPAPPERGEVMVRIHAMALNRLDLFVMEGLPGANSRFPHVVGSDGAGTVHQVGAGVTGLRPGDRVMINPTLSCGSCPACLAGEHSLCHALSVLGEHQSGTAAEYLVVPAENLALVPAAMPWPQKKPHSLMQQWLCSAAEGFLRSCGSCVTNFAPRYDWIAIRGLASGGKGGVEGVK